MEPASLQLFYDIQQNEAEEGKTSTKIIIFVMIDLEHKPVLVFNYEELLAYDGDYAEACEMYMADIKVTKDNNLIMIQCGEKSEMDSRKKESVLSFDGKKLCHVSGEKVKLTKTIFNSYQYNEPELQGRIEQLEEDIEEIIEQIKALRKALK